MPRTSACTVRPACTVRRAAVALVALAVLAVAGVTGCSDEASQPPPSPSTDPPVGEPSVLHSPTPSPTAAPVPEPVGPDDVDVATAVATVRHLAGTIGPRMATGPEFQRASRWVAAQLRSYGHHVEREVFDVPAGTSWGVDVAAGRSHNLVAALPGLDTTRPHLVVGAHLDTVPQAPGAEDNASGVGALLAVAEAVADRQTRLPVVLVVFGAEEPRGPGDDDHHYGSRHHVAELDAAERKALRGMVSLDRVGVGKVLPVCSAGAPDRLRAQLADAARRAGATTTLCSDNRSSDHWSFVRAGLPGVRLGSTPYAGYHGPGDLPGVVDRAQLDRAARTTVAWLGPQESATSPD